MDATAISIHAPHAGRDYLTRLAAMPEAISIHAPHAGRDCSHNTHAAPDRYFNPRAPCGARQFYDATRSFRITFQSTRPMRGATLPRESRGREIRISIHAPHAGRDRTERPLQARIKAFQSTRPMRGATAKVYKITLHTFATKGNS